MYDIDTRDNRYTFATLAGKNIQLSNKDSIARRIAGYNQAIVVTAQPLTVNNPFTVSYRVLACYGALRLIYIEKNFLLIFLHISCIFLHILLLYFC